MGKVIEKEMQIDVNVNLTFEVVREDFEEWQKSQREYEEDDSLEMFVTELLEGEEIYTDAGNAWVCSVDMVAEI